jgi:hypothetical protein
MELYKCVIGEQASVRYTRELICSFYTQKQYMYFVD